MLLRSLGKRFGYINCIPNNDKKYISFSKGLCVGHRYRKGKNDKKGGVIYNYHQTKFLDSFKFMPTSISNLVKKLKEEDFKIVKKYFQGDKFSLLMRKGVHPYDYIDSPERFKETQLPPKEVFYSKLEDENITDEDFAHAQKVWKTFNMKPMGDYHDFYNKLDLLQLADIFENFRKVCYKHYGLDPAHYFTALGLACDAALKVTGVELELRTDPNMLLMLEKGIRGVVSMISTRY